ncbi:hypothetical protein [Amaricoccus sp.]|uniref:hypothetical protein n=1 Tax=Amaricoccus sp. TaxID=1872485 RepID=UPI001B785099|nr:hypothetical protein [Amaricoccus sp.]MBP7001609.1 hypothetical protein [Amaricoccus sp.]
MATYEEGAPVYKKSILDWSINVGDFSFSMADAKALMIEDYLITYKSRWRKIGQLPLFYITASEHVGELGRYVNLFVGEHPHSFQGTFGYFACVQSDCSGNGWGGSGNSAYGGTPQPVPLPPALALMAAPLMGLAWVKRRRKRESEA